MTPAARWIPALALAAAGLASGTARADHACPAGTEARGAAPPDGYSAWCERDGQRHGPQTMWFPGGQVMEQMNFADGRMHGLQRSYHRNGRPASEARYDRGTPVGTAVSWHPNGVVSARKPYKDGALHGSAQHFHASGRLKADLILRRGVLRLMVSWHERGEVRGVLAPGADLHGSLGRYLDADDCWGYAAAGRAVAADVTAERRILDSVDRHLLDLCSDTLATRFADGLCYHLDAAPPCEQEERALIKRDLMKRRVNWRARARARVDARPKNPP